MFVLFGAIQILLGESSGSHKMNQRSRDVFPSCRKEEIPLLGDLENFTAISKACFIAGFNLQKCMHEKCAIPLQDLLKPLQLNSRCSRSKCASELFRVHGRNESQYDYLPGNGVTQEVVPSVAKAESVEAVVESKLLRDYLAFMTEVD